MRAAIGAGDLPITVRAERVELAPTRQTVELLAELAVAELEQVEQIIGDRPERRPDLVALRIKLIDALAELRGER